MKKNKLLNLRNNQQKLNLPIWLLFLFTSIEFIPVVQKVLQYSNVVINGSTFNPSSSTFLVVNIISIVLYLLVITFFHKNIESIIKTFAIIGSIGTILMLFQNYQMFEIGVFVNSIVCSTNSYLILTYLSIYFSIKNVIINSLIGTFLFKALAELLSNTIINTPLIILIITMLICYIMFIVSFLFFPQHEKQIFKHIKKEEDYSPVASPSKQPPYFLYILLILFIGLISGLKSVIDNILIITTFSNFLYTIGSIISGVFTLCIILKNGAIKFFDLMYLFLYGFTISLILLLIHNDIVYYIGSALLGLFSLPLSVTLILSAILFTKTNKITTPIWIICLNSIFLHVFDEILNKISSMDGLITFLIPVAIISIIVLYLLKPHLNFGIEQHNFEFKDKNIATNPLSYLSELELSFVILSCEGFTTNQITEILKLTPQNMKEVRLRTYGMLKVKNKKELVDLVVNYKI